MDDDTAGMLLGMPVEVGIEARLADGSGAEVAPRRISGWVMGRFSRRMVVRMLSATAASTAGVMTTRGWVDVVHSPLPGTVGAARRGDWEGVMEVVTPGAVERVVLPGVGFAESGATSLGRGITCTGEWAGYRLPGAIPAGLWGCRLRL